MPDRLRDLLGEVSNPLRLEGNRSSPVRVCLLGKVSNPLRLEGNEEYAKFCELVGNVFLIHYGWRGTVEEEYNKFCQLVFLIHYGWRGTGVVP